MRIHFIGIGGIGVSALARYYLAKGHDVSGSDLSMSEITQDLRQKGAEISIGPHQTSNIKLGMEKVIHTVAISENSRELQEAKRINAKIQTYPEALGELTKKHFTIAICGAHGKGTTTALTSLILIKAGLDPTVIVGTNLKEFNNSNCRIGKSDYLIIEADEYRRAFLNYWPQIIILTNIDREHLDCYKNLNEIIDSFREFINHLPRSGKLIANQDNNNVKSLLNLIRKDNLKIKKFSIKQKEGSALKKILQVPGKHNISNALGALTAARELGIKDKISFEALSGYKGAWRRFEICQTKWDTKEITIVSDYAHHPSEVRATLDGAREKFKKRRIWAIFQPHQYHRTHYLFNEFISAFDEADQIIITEIYNVAGREKEDIKKRVNGEKLARAISRRNKKVHFVKDLEQIPQYLKDKARSQDIIIIMGAGSVYKIVKNLIE